VSRLSPLARDYETVGDLYGMLVDGLRAFVAEKGESTLFVGDPAMQVDATLAPLPGVCRVVDLASAEQAVQTIVAQGEGAGAESTDSHFSRFRRVREELDALLAEDPSFAPAWPAATNPLMNLPPVSEGRVHVDHPDIVPWLDIGNAMYTTSLRCLVQGFVARDRRQKSAWLRASFELMKAVTPVGQGLAARPAKDSPDSPNAGLSFTTLRTLGWLPDPGGPASISERVGELAARARALVVVPVEGESPETWSRVIAALDDQQAKIGAIATMASSAAVPPPVVGVVPGAPPAARPAPAAPPPAVERARGAHLSVLFEAKRCIHSRHCVLDAPTVFKANTPGEWIFPDTVDKETVIEVAHRCPSGAIRYERHDGGVAEALPKVNTLFVRENGPLRRPRRARRRRGHQPVPRDPLPLRPIQEQTLLRWGARRAWVRRERGARDQRPGPARRSRRGPPSPAPPQRSAGDRRQPRDLRRHRTYGRSRHQRPALPMWSLEEQAILRHDPRVGRLRGGVGRGAPSRVLAPRLTALRCGRDSPLSVLGSAFGAALRADGGVSLRRG
jgi:uncharacterized Fe-S cluster protein YjdI